MSITLHLSLTSSPSTPRVSISVPQDPPATGADLRQLASTATKIPLQTMKLIYRGRVIANKEEGDVVKEFKLEEDSVIHVMGKPAATTTAATASSSSSVSAATSSNNGASVNLQTNASSAATAPSTDASPVSAALTTLRTSNSNDVYRTALSTADKLLNNIISHPMEEKYRTIKKSNPAFNKRLGGVSGGEALLLASGFTIETVDGNEVYVLRPSAQAWPKLVAAGDEVKRTVAENSNQSNFTHPTSSTAPPMAAGGGMFPGMPGGGMGMGMGGGGMDAAMQQMMNDPNMMQNMMGMMNNPQVQNMMRNDPRLANNPMALQALDELQRNPQMMQQVQQMMADPSMRENMSRMMQQQQQSQQSGAGGAAPPFGGNNQNEMLRQMEQFQRMSQSFNNNNSSSGAGAPSSAAPNQSASTSQNDDEMTEEEMIAEAIRRSLGES